MRVSSSAQVVALATAARSESVLAAAGVGSYQPQFCGHTWMVTASISSSA